MDDNNHKYCIETKSDTIILDKLAQLSYGSDKSININSLQKRARAKYLTNSITLGLINNNPESPLKKSYWNTYHCSNSIAVVGNKAESKYCKNRFCLVCSRIKTATYINSYLSVVKKLEDKQFVTLTVPNVPLNKLEYTINDMQKTFYKLINKNNMRGKFKGIRKLEITYNPLRNDYHPHYHIILSGPGMAEFLYKHWLDTYKNANEKAQDIRPISDEDDLSLIELFKYATKIIQKDIDKPKNKTVYFDALDAILRCLKGRRTFQPFGIKKPKIDDDYSLEMENKSLDVDFFEWEQEIADWVSKHTGECLTGYEPSEVISKFVKNIGKKSKSL